MFVARTPEDRTLLDRFEPRMRGLPTKPAPSKPLTELEPLTDSQYEQIRSALTEQVEPLRQAYLRGMVVARDDEQRDVLARLRGLIGRGAAERS